MSTPAYFVPAQANEVHPDAVARIALGIPRGETLGAALRWSRFAFNLYAFSTRRHNEPRDRGDQ